MSKQSSRSENTWVSLASRNAYLNLSISDGNIISQAQTEVQIQAAGSMDVSSIHERPAHITKPSNMVIDPTKSSSRRYV